MAELPHWPVSLPCALIEGYQVSPGMANAIRTSIEGGAPRMRRRFTNVPLRVTCVVSLSRGQVQTLDDFVAITLADVGAFRWMDFRRPVDGINNAAYRFLARPSYAPSGTGNRWRASLELELLTTADGRFLLDVSDANTGLTNT